MVDGIVDGGLGSTKPEIRVGMWLVKVAGRPVEKLDDAHYFFSSARWPLKLEFTTKPQGSKPPTGKSSAAPVERASQDEQPATAAPPAAAASPAKPNPETAVGR